MNHTERALHHTAERYLLNMLAPDERAEFEEHFIGCAECIAGIEMAHALRSGMTHVAAEEAARSKHPKKSLRIRFAAWYVKHSKWGQTWMLVAACALFTAGPFLFFYTRLRDANRHAAALQAESSNWERRYFSEKENADRLKRLVDQVRAGQSMVTQLVRPNRRLGPLVLRSSRWKPEPSRNLRSPPAASGCSWPCSFPSRFPIPRGPNCTWAGGNCSPKFRDSSRIRVGKSRSA